MTSWKRLSTTFGVAALLGASAYATSYSVSTATDFVTKETNAKAGDIITLTANISLPCDTYIHAGTTLDLGTHKVTFPDLLPDGRPSRGFAVEGGNITVQNGTIDNGKWGLYAFNPAANYVFKNLHITRTLCFLKMGGAGGDGITNNILVDTVDVQCDPNPWTIIDLGPARVSGVVIKNYTSKAVITSNDTGSDGIGIEQAQDTVTIQNAHVDGASGDGIDIKGAANISDSLVTNAARQSFKIWGLPGVASSLLRCVAVHNGQGGMANGGTVTMTDDYFEGGYNDDTAFFWGVGKVAGGVDHWGNPDNYGTGTIVATVTNCQFIRNTGTSVLLTAETTPTPASIKFTNCSFWNPRHPNLYVGPTLEMVADAQAAKWPSNFINCKYLNVPPPGGTPTVTTVPLTVTLTASPIAPKPGDAVTYTMVCTNPATHTMKSAVLHESVPAGTKLVPGGAILDGKSVTLTPDASGKFSLALGDVAPNASHTLLLMCTVQ